MDNRLRHMALFLILVALLLVPKAGLGSLPSDFTDSGVEVFPLRTGTTYRFKGLAVAPDGRRLFLGSWDKKQIVLVTLSPSSVTEVDSPYRNRLNSMGVYLRGDTLYAVMNEVDDAQNARPVSALVLFDTRTERIIRSYEVRGDRTGRHHFNHVVVDVNGRAFVSNTLKGSIWTVDTRDPRASLELLIEHPKLRLIHGITLAATDRLLYVTSYEAGFGVIDLDALTYASLQQPDSRGNDGLRYHRGFLYAVGQNTLTRHRLSSDGRRVLSSTVLLKDHPYFNDPRCLEIVGDSLFILANIEHAPVSFRDGGTRRNDALTDTYVLRYPLPAA